MNSLFTNLRRLASSQLRQQDEDFFTEIAASLFTACPETLIEWLGTIPGFSVCGDERVTVSTQAVFSNSEFIDQGRRPDMKLILTDSAGGFHVVFLESKVAAKAGDGQLSDYAELLAGEFSSAQKRSLLYVTRDFDAEDLPDSPVTFYKTRWYTLHQVLAGRVRRQVASYLEREAKLYMEESGMATGTRFKPEHLVGLAAFSQVESMMLETLAGADRRLLRMLGSRQSRTINELTQHNRFTIHCDVENLHVLMGFFLGRDLGDYPSLALLIQVREATVADADVWQSLSALSGESDWAVYRELGDDWSGIIRERSLRTFLTKDDHVDAMKKYFGELVADLQRIVDTHPSWFGQPSDDV